MPDTPKIIELTLITVAVAAPLIAQLATGKTVGFPTMTFGLGRLIDRRKHPGAYWATFARWTASLLGVGVCFAIVAAIST
jgi:hypothetical protein